MEFIFYRGGATAADLALFSNHEPTMDALYAMIDRWEEPERAQKRYQDLYEQIIGIYRK